MVTGKDINCIEVFVVEVKNCIYRVSDGRIMKLHVMWLVTVGLGPVVVVEEFCSSNYASLNNM